MELARVRNAPKVNFQSDQAVHYLANIALEGACDRIQSAAAIGCAQRLRQSRRAGGNDRVRFSTPGALDHLARLAGMPLANLGETVREAVAGQFRASGGAAAATLTRVVLQCYYRDDRVLRSLGLELRPPFPKGYGLEQGDWSLLEPVKARPSMWRRAPSRPPD